MKIILNGRSTISALAAAALGICLAQPERPQAHKPSPVTDSASQNCGTAGKLGHIPLLRTSNGPSLNWSGYAVSALDVTSVTATFTVPEIGPPGSIEGLPPDFSAWVGIDGYTSGTVEQTGISGTWDDKTGAAIYNAWWEMYPRSSSTIKKMNISAGDLITATVTYLGGTSFTLSIIDNTTGESFSTTASAPSAGQKIAERSSAEFVVERAATINTGYLTILPLATFTTDEVFTDASFTAGGTTMPLQQAADNLTQYSGSGTPPPQPYWEQMTMVGLDDDSNPYPLDSVSAVTGNSFSTTFLDNGTPVAIPGVYRQK